METPTPQTELHARRQATLRGSYRVGFAVIINRKVFCTANVFVTSENGTEALRLVRTALSEVRLPGEHHQIREVYFSQPIISARLTSHSECIAKIGSALRAADKAKAIMDEELSSQIYYAKEANEHT